MKKPFTTLLDFQRNPHILPFAYIFLMLELKNITISVGEKQIIKNLNFTFEKQTTTIILGHNGSGKSSLALAIAGHPRYHQEGDIVLDNENISHLNPSERHKKGIFLSFQNIPEIP